MAMTLSEDKYNALMAKVDNYEAALRDIASWFDEGLPHSHFEALASVADVLADLKAEGYLS